MNDFELGEIRQASLWFKDKHRKQAEKYLKSVFDSDTEEYGVIFSSIRFLEVYNHQLIPPEPDAKILMAEAVVNGFKSVKSDDMNFLMDLDSKNLNLLRDITQNAYLKLNPSKPPLPLDKLDNLVGRIGYETADRLLRENYSRTHH